MHSRLDLARYNNSVDLEAKLAGDSIEDRSFLRIIVHYSIKL